jgi:threonine-phosphate decarboxylase
MMNDSMQRFVPVHGGQLRQIAIRFQLPEEAFIDFSANINPDGPPPSVLLAIQRCLAEPTTLTAYPDLELMELKQSIAHCNGERIEHIAVANGFVPLLSAALQSQNIRRCLLPVPCFSEYRRTLETSNVVVVPYLLSAVNSFCYEPNEILAALLEHSCDSILLANPQNPSGVLYDAEQMQGLIALCATHNIKVLLDEAFIDYCTAHSLTQHASKQSNLIVLRSVTKFFAVPGLRVAYAVSNSTTTSALNRFITPWPITTLASDGVCAALKDAEFAEESRLRNNQRRSWLKDELQQLQIATYPASANFLLLRFPTAVDVGLLWERMIVEEQIVLRSCANFEGLEANHLRIAVRSDLDNERLIGGLRRVLHNTRK